MSWYALVLVSSLWSWQSPLLATYAPATKGLRLVSQHLFFMPPGRSWTTTDTGDHQKLEPLARSITVKVLVGRNSGSGILIQKQGPLYSVLTNHHVVNAGKSYRIQTPDGKIYAAKVLENHHFNRQSRFLGNDLDVLQFSSSRAYTIATLNPTAKLEVGEAVFAAGFPHDYDPAISEEFVFTDGYVSFVLDRSFVGGYRIGYTNWIQQGMSGGPLMNWRGDVIGVNGLHAYPLWGNPYVFKDGSSPHLPLRKEIARSSWAIPIATFICLTPLTKMTLTTPVKRELCARDRSNS